MAAPEPTQILANAALAALNTERMTGAYPVGLAIGVMPFDEDGKLGLVLVGERDGDQCAARWFATAADMQSSGALYHAAYKVVRAELVPSLAKWAGNPGARRVELAKNRAGRFLDRLRFKRKKTSLETMLTKGSA